VFETKKKILICVIVIALLIGSFLAGGFVKEKKQAGFRVQRCCTLISFAIDKAENEDLSDQSTMQALISNVYAAYEFCDDAHSAKQLHDLWNNLLSENDDAENVQLIILQELDAVLNDIKPAD